MKNKIRFDSEAISHFLKSFIINTDFFIFGFLLRRNLSNEKKKEEKRWRNNLKYKKIKKKQQISIFKLEVLPTIFYFLWFLKIAYGKLNK